MKAWGLALLAIVGLSGTAPAAQPYETLVVVRPRPPVVRLVEARDLAADVNRVRALARLPAVTVDPLLSTAALLHARDMASRRFFGHVTPDGSSLPDRLGRLGFRWSLAAENIALDQDEPHANSALLQSAAHRANILDPRVRKIGVAAVAVGIGATLYVEDFAT